MSVSISEAIRVPVFYCMRGFGFSRRDDQVFSGSVFSESAYWFARSRRYACLALLVFALGVVLVAAAVCVLAWSQVWLSVLVVPVLSGVAVLFVWLRRNASDAGLFARLELNYEWSARPSVADVEEVSL